MVALHIKLQCKKNIKYEFRGSQIRIDVSVLHTSIGELFGNWLNGVDKGRIRIGVSALCWSIWNCRNTIVFDKQKGTNFL
jgi:hypothetical protein